MTTLRRKILLNALKLLDLTIMVLVFALAAVPVWGVGQTVSITEFFSMRVKVGNLFILVALIFLWYSLFSAFGLYESRRLCVRMAEVADVAKATSVGTLFLWGTSLFFHIRMAS